MRKVFNGVILSVTAVALAVGATAAAHAKGNPHRSSDIPPGLSKNFERGIQGILRAIEASDSSNSRLQDLPISV